jgi:hemerythrin
MLASSRSTKFIPENPKNSFIMAGNYMGLAWREQLSVGNDLIDSDHKYLIEIINAATTHLKSKNWLDLKTSFEKLARYSYAHFLTEEKIALAVGFPTAEHLHESHAALLSKLEYMAQEVSEVWSDESIEKFNGLLRDWLINHVIKEDMLLRPYLKKYSPRFDPR